MGWTIGTVSARYKPLAKAIGKRFGLLTATGFRKCPRYSVMECVCDCGSKCDRPLYALNHGLAKSCGCARNRLPPRKPTTRVCQYCGATYQGWGKSKYCSKRCNWRIKARYTGPITKTCIECGSTFASNHGRMCSEDCRANYSQRKTYAKRLERKFHLTMKRIEEEKAMSEALTAEVQAMTTEQLHTELAKGLSLTATTLTRLGVIWRELERRGVDMSKYKVGIARNIPRIACGRIAAETVVAFAERPSVVDYLEGLDLEHQRRYANGEPIPVYVPGEAEPVMMPIAKIPRRIMHHVFSDGMLRTPAEQKLSMQSLNRKRRNGKTRVFYKVNVNPDDRLVQIGRSTATIETVVAALSNAASPVEVTESTDRPARTIAGKVTDDEKERIVAAAKAHGISESEMVRRAVLAMWLL